MTGIDELFTAITAGDAVAVERLIDDDPSLATSRRDGVSALRLAAYVGHPELAKPLEARGATPDAFDAAALGELDTIRDLLDEEPELASAFSDDGFTALHLAAWFGHTKIAEILLARGADPRVVAANSTALEPLNSAAAAGNPVIAHLLLDRGAEVDAVQQGGITPLHSAAAHNDAEMVSLLLGRGADPSQTTDAGQSAADLATETSVLALLP